MASAADAILLDTSDLDADAAFEAALSIVRIKITTP
jgi:cytidylate kinase